MTEIIYARDLDGTGSMHVCSKGDPGAVAFAPIATNPAGFTARIQQICEDRCAEVGDPACWRLPDMVEPCEHITPCDDCIRDAAKQGRAILSAKDRIREAVAYELAGQCYWDETGVVEAEELEIAIHEITNGVLPVLLYQATGMNLRPLSFSTEGFAHTGLGAFYHIGPPDNGSAGYVLYRYEGSSKTGLGWHPQREELEKLAGYDHAGRMALAYETPPDPEGAG